MKKFGKFEKRPETDQKKQPNVKSALLQTYMTSLLCLLLCVTMFFGTSYAWFTSEVNNEGNEIYIGTLDVGLFKQIKVDDAYTWVSLDNSVTRDTSYNLFDKGIRWEPGFTALETIKVVNEGDLAFKYELSFTDGKLANGGDLSAVADEFEIWVYDCYDNEHYTKEGVTPNANPESYSDISEKTGWTPVGTLKDVLEGQVVLKGNMITVRQQDVTTVAEATEPTRGPNDSVATEDIYIIALHMKDDADSSVMGHRISLNAKLIAYQRSGENSENDAFGPTYDYFAELTEIVEKQVKFNEYDAGEISCVGFEEPVTLDAAYQFRPDVSHEEVVEKNPPFRYWHADFVVSADQDVPANSVALAGYYSAYCDTVTSGAWVALTSPEAIKAGQEIRLIEAMGQGSISVNYEEICLFGNDGTGFLCGILDIPDGEGKSQNEGTTITVELRLYETEEPSAENGNSSNVETGRYIVVGSYSYTFPSTAQSD